MATIQDLVAPLSQLTKKCIDARLFGYAENFCNVLAAVDSDRWRQLATDEQVYWLGELRDLVSIKALGDTGVIDTDDADFRRVQELVDGFQRALQ